MNPKDTAIANFFNALTGLLQAVTPAVKKAVEEYVRNPTSGRR